MSRTARRALVMVLHDVNLAARYCDHVLLLDRGTALAGRADELLTGERLSALYGLPLRRLASEGRSVFVT
jgi:ABC-type cobalamin/Fe3+-siderophores transport system ATPase subunit